MNIYRKYVNEFSIEDKRNIKKNNIFADEIILIDRSLDLVSPLIKNSSFEGVLYDEHELNYSIINVNNKKKILNSKNNIFEFVRDKEFTDAVEYFRDKIKEISKIYKEVIH